VVAEPDPRAQAQGQGGRRGPLGEMTDAVSAGQGGLARRAEAKLQLARAGDGGQPRRVEGGGGAVIRKAGDRAAEAERPRGRDFFRPPPGAKDGIDRLRRSGIGRRAGESKSENEQRWASDPRLPEKRALEPKTNNDDESSAKRILKTSNRGGRLRSVPDSDRERRAFS